MTDVILYLFENFPWIVWPVVIISIIVTFTLLGLIIAASIQGRPVEVGPVTIGGNVPEPQPPANTVIKVNADITEKHMKEIADKVAERVAEIKKEDEEFYVSEDMYRPASPPWEFMYPYRAKLDIENRLRRIVLSHGGPWAGHSMTKGEIYYQMAAESSYIDESLAEDIALFYKGIDPLLGGVTMFDDSFESLQSLVTHIVRRLESIQADIDPSQQL